jgi:TolB-like protein
MATPDAKRFWKELLRRRVVRVAVIYIAGAWILAQAVDLLLDAFDASQYMRFVVAGLAVGLPIALVLSWVFDITPSGIERTPDRPEPGIYRRPHPRVRSRCSRLRNLSQDVENEYFSDGLSEEIRNQLARVSGLRVAARTSSFAFKGRHEDVREIGRRLSVATVLEGGVRKQADTVRIDVQLVSAADGYQIWSQTFERRLDDIFRLQSEVASAVIAAIGPRKDQRGGRAVSAGDAERRGLQSLPARPPPFSQAHRGIAGACGGLLRAGYRA